MNLPAQFNIAEYCLGPAAHRDRAKTAMIVVADADASREAADHWTYGDIRDAVLRIAAGIQAKGLEPGARIMIRMGNTSDYALLYFGILAAGYVAVPSSAQLTDSEAQFLVEDSGASVLAVAEDLSLAHVPEGVEVWTPADLADLRRHEPLTEFAATQANDPAYLVYTSGTSGKPKGVLHAHRSVWGRRPMYQGWYGMGQDDRLLHAGAFNWTYTLGVGLSDPWANGATSILYNGPKDIAVWPKLIEKFGATMLAGVPTLYRQILKHCDLGQYDLSTLRHGLTAGEPLPLSVATNWRDKTGTDLFEALGMSECSTYISCSPTVAIKPGSPGKPQDGRRVAILSNDESATVLPPNEIGLLAVHKSDPGLMLRYWNRPQEDAEVTRGEWFVGGDLALLDDDGYLWFQGRNDDVMTSMGYRVSPAEVETALASHAHIAEVAVTEIAASNGMRIISAFVVMAEGAKFDPDSILAHGAENLADYKRPRQVFEVQALPRTANGKVQRNKLNDLAI